MIHSTKEIKVYGFAGIGMRVGKNMGEALIKKLFGGKIDRCEVLGCDAKIAWTCRGLVPGTYLIYAASLSNARGLLPPRVECLRRGLWNPLIYSNKAISTCLRVCQVLRQMSSALRVLKKASAAALSPGSGARAGSTISLPAHRYFEVIFLEPFLIIVRVILAASIGVMNAVFGWLAKRTAGDCHANQGQGEVCGTGIECPMTVTMKFDIRKDLRIKELQYIRPSPSAKTDTAGYYGTSAHGPDLYENAQNAVRYMIEWLVDNHDLTRDQAYALCGAVANLHISEIVDAPNWIVSAQVPLCIFKS